MGWLPSIFGGGSSSDPLSNLDPKLREFLNKESPVKYNATKAQQPAAPTTTSTTAPTAQNSGSGAPATGDAKSSGVPSESLYQDGRYAHLWKNYRPLAQIEEETSTEQEKLVKILDGYKERKQAIGIAAMENCAIQQEEWINCMKNGSWTDQLQMCRHQVHRYERCYTMQSRFLRALGYGSVIDRPAQVEEDIQMHADKLFNRMLEHERAVAAAKEAGLPAPIFDSVVPRPPPRAATTATPAEDVERTWRETLAKLPAGDERAAEEAALRADFQAKEDVARSVKEIMDARTKEREARQAAGQATLTDTLSGLWGGSKGGK
ncbi:hypothetical protein ISF_03306 [Cordyceps fumosorosea ARSEF 2679]|uniref:Autophagy-related protein 6 n=1 Tax=Cordyceps fumosorosea (strain ARSEF 2679) TaxID=1081104 RepID=A0A168AM48_CORFA|nr:hypothetical protein ISF_03306 [Cordyceps fumosorosea ARSEF 2679]OAA68931.1 hypothetical protein ISF_03306 [Cordyceps fumosorosea ARSEF 2679]